MRDLEIRDQEIRRIKKAISNLRRMKYTVRVERDEDLSSQHYVDRVVVVDRMEGTIISKKGIFTVQTRRTHG